MAKGLKSDEAQAAVKTVVIPGLTLFGKWLLTRPRIQKLLGKLGIK